MMARVKMSMTTPKLMPISCSNSGRERVGSLMKRQRGPLYEDVQLRTTQRNLRVHSRGEHEPTCACGYESELLLIITKTCSGCTGHLYSGRECECACVATLYILHAKRFVAVLGVHALATVFAVLLVLASTRSVQVQNARFLRTACRRKRAAS